MRIVGHLPSESSAVTFSDFLCVQGISSQIEAEKDGWAVWIHSEDELTRARELLHGYVGNPNDPQYHKHAQKARQIREQAEREEAAAEKRQYDRRRLFRSGMPGGVGLLTFVLIGVSVGVYLLRELGYQRLMDGYLMISLYERGLPEIRKGEVWRLVTPILLHFHILHILFNMMWLFDLGTMIESRQGTRRLGFLVLLIAITSNLAQFYLKGPAFGGMSGVVYGLLGYVWMKGKFDPDSGLFLHPQTVGFMLVWFFLCLFGIIPNVANTVHFVGLVMGILAGILSSQGRR